jgi:hypothetical protein
MEFFIFDIKLPIHYNHKPVDPNRNFPIPFVLGVLLDFLFHNMRFKITLTL